MPEQALAYTRINVADVTPRTSPPYGSITHTERNSQYVLRAENGKMLIGPLGVNYYEDGPSDNEVVYLHRWDAPPRRTRMRKSRFSLNRQTSEG